MSQPTGFDDRGQPRPQGPLTDAHVFFRHLANSAHNSDLRPFCARIARCIEFFQRTESLFPKEFEPYNFDDSVHQLSNEEIVYWLALNLQPGSTSPLWQLLSETELPWVLLEVLERDDIAGCWRGRDYDVVLTFVCVVFRSAIEREYSSRRLQNESKDGRVVREILVEEKDRGKLLFELGRRINRRYGALFFPFETRWAGEEAQSEACAALWEEISPFAGMDPVATNPQCLLAFLQGTLNAIPEKARHHVRTRIKTASRHEKIVLAEHTLSSPHSDELKPAIAEMIGDRSVADVGFTKVLFEQFVSALEPADKRILELSIQGHSQQETAALLGVTQSKISKRLTSIRLSWQEVVHRSAL